MHQPSCNREHLTRVFTKMPGLAFISLLQRVCLKMLRCPMFEDQYVVHHDRPLKVTQGGFHVIAVVRACIFAHEHVWMSICVQIPLCCGSTCGAAHLPCSQAHKYTRGWCALIGFECGKVCLRMCLSPCAKVPSVWWTGGCFFSECMFFSCVGSLMSYGPLAGPNPEAPDERP